MVKTRHSANKDAEPSQPPATLPVASPAPTSDVPPHIRFPLLVLFSMGLSSLLYNFVSPFTAGDLAIVSNTLDNWTGIYALLAWKAAKLGVGWYGGYDSSDITAMTFLSHAPYLYFLTSFYTIRPSTAFACMAIDLLAVWLPFYTLKVSSSIHSVKTPKGVAANRSVINDFGVQIATSLLGAGVYALVVLASYSTWLPTYLVTHFDGIRDISALHNKNFPFLAASFLPLGFAAKVFLFTPATAAKPDRHDKEVAGFNPETATLAETVWYNVWGYSKRTRVLIKRTVTLVAVVALQTSLQTYITIEGAEAFGAVGWSSVWALAATLTGAVFWYVTDVQGIDN
ncbi:hypothetical protein ACLMJK_008864 [Lecanora helva]